MKRKLILYSKEQKNEYSLQGKLGLINYGDSSFVNAIIQALSNIEQLCFIIRILPSDVVHSVGCIQDAEGRKKRSDVFFALRRLLRELWTDKRVVIEPAILIRRMNQLSILKDAITNANIEDTFVYLLECLHECLQQSIPPQFEPRVNFSPDSPVWSLPQKGIGAYQRSLVSDTLQGISTSVCTCKSCGFVEKRMDAFLVLRIDLVKLSSKSDSVGVQQKNASSHYMTKTTRKMVTQQTTDAKGQNVVVTFLKRVASMTEHHIEHIPSVDSGRTIPGRIMQFIRSHTKQDINLSRADDPIKSLSMKFSFRSNRVAIEPHDDSQNKNPAITLLNAPIEEDDTRPAPPLGKIMEVPSPSKPQRRNDQVVKPPTTARRNDQVLKPPTDVFIRDDPTEAKDCEDRFSLRSSPNLVAPGCDRLIQDTVAPVNDQPKSSVSDTNVVAGTNSIPTKRRIVKKLSKAASSVEDRSYKNPIEYIRQNSTGNRLSSPKEFKSSPSLPSYPQNSLISALQTNNFFDDGKKPSIEIPDPAIQPLSVNSKQEEEYLHSLPPVTPTRYDRKSSMKLDSLPNSSSLTPRDSVQSSNLIKLHTEGESTHIHSSESLVPEIDPFTWENIKYQIFTTLQNGADEVLNAIGLRQYGSCFNLNDCLKNTFSATTTSQFCVHCNSNSASIETTKTLSCAPEVLVLYFDRFVNFGWKHTKIKNLVSFPFEGLDLTDYIDSQSSYFESSFKQNPIYDLSVLIEHVGTDKTRNRYITIAKHLPEGKWFEYDDHLVREISEGNLRKREALFLFYVKRKPPTGTTHGDNHRPLGEIQELCHNMLEKRFDDIQNERKYLAKVRKQKQRKLQKLNPLSRPQQNLGDQQDANHHSNGEDGTAQESYDPGQSEKTLKVPHTHPESQTKWDIIRDNLEVIRSYRNSKPLRLNSKWQIVQQNLPTILAMRKIEEQPNNMSNNEEKNSQPSGHESQVIIRKGRSSFNHFLETSFRRSQRMFTPLSISPIKNPRNNLLHSFLKSTIFTVRYLDDDELDLDSSDDKYIIPNSLPTLDESDPDSSLVYISSYWLMKFLSFSNPGPICNHDIACSHGYLKPHLHGCKKYICVPITVSLLLQIEKYLFEEFNYPLFSEQALGMKQINENDNHQYFRYLKAMTPCVLCTNEFEKLQQKRSDELERVMIEHLQDGYEEPLAENLHDEVLKETIAEAKRQNKSVLQQKRKTTIHNSRLRRVNLLTRAHFAFASSWMKKEPSSPSSVQSLSQSVQNEIPAEEVETPIGNLETPKTFNELTFHPKLQSDYSSDSDFSGSINSTSRRSTSALLAAKLMRKISASPSKSGIIFKSYSPYDPILAIRPLSEIPYCCILHSGWFHSWKRYIQSGLFEDIEYPVLHPGPITNHLLLKKSFRRGSILENKIKSSNIPPLQRDSSYARLNMKGNHLSSTSNTSTSASASMESNTIIISSGITILNDYLKKDLNLHHDYIVVSPNVWKVLHGIYGGGPPIFREDINIYSQEYNFEGKPLFSVGTTSSIVQGQPQPQPPTNL